jgi:ABC-type multidrug transport system fused ATPase/permease subunit
MAKQQKRQIALNETTRLVRRLIVDYGLQFRVRFATAVVCMLFVAASTGMIAWLSRSMVNNIFVDGDQRAIWGVGVAIMLAFLVKGVSSYLQAVLMGSIGTAITANLQRAQFDKLLHMKLGYFSGRHAGGVVSKVIHSSRAAKTVVTLVTTNFFRDLFTLFALTGVMIYQDPFMSIFALLAAPVIIVALYFLTRAIKQVTQAESDLIAGVNVVGVEALQGLKVVKTFTLEDQMRERIGGAVNKMETRQNAITRIAAITSPLFDVLGGLIIGLFIFYAGWQTIENNRTPGEFMAFITAFLLAFEPARRLGNMNVQIQKHIVAVKDMFDLLENDKDIEDSLPMKSQLAGPSGGHAGLRFEKVNFNYAAKGAPTLRQVSFEAASNESLAIVGRSGAGKSTIVNLVLGLYSPASGQIFLNGRPLTDYSLAQLRQNVSYVAQDTFLFSGSVRDNVAYGKPGATDEEITAALQGAGAMDFVSALPRGMDTDVGDNGAKLSGGQKQRIAIARALLKDAPLLIFDEATSALDGETERYLRNTLNQMKQGRTTIVIAHRLSTIQEADKVLVIDQGTVIGSGTHEELSAENEVYRALFTSGELQANEPLPA